MALVVKVHLPMGEGRLLGSRAPRTLEGVWQPTPVFKPGEEPHGPRSLAATVHKVTKKKVVTLLSSEHPCRSQATGEAPLHSPGLSGTCGDTKHIQEEGRVSTQR